MEQIWTLGGLFVLLALTVACIWLFQDNVKLRAKINEVSKQKDDLAIALKASIDRQAELVAVLKFVMQGEIRTARNDEREAIFSDALRKLNNIERDIVINNNVQATAQRRDGGLDVSGGTVVAQNDIVGGNETKE